MVDAHVHLERGPYTAEWLDRFIRRAVDAGLEEIRLLEHSHRFREFAPMYKEAAAYSPYQRQWLEQRCCLDLRDYTVFVRRMKQRSYPLRVRFGLEVCYFPGHEELVRRFAGEPFDFLTGSVHWIDGWGFDHKPELWRGVDVDRAYRRYYELMEELIRSRLFHTVAHPDSIKCFGHSPSFPPEPLWRKVAQLAREHGTALEQSAGLHINYGYPTLGMDPGLLKTALREGVEVVTASDAHRPEDTGRCIREMAEELHQLSKIDKQPS